MRRQNDDRANKSYMNRWTEQTEETDRARVAIENKRKQKMVANQQFLRDQMGNMILNNPSGAGSSGASGEVGSPPKNKKKYELGGMMNPEEARMNRALLQEIARVKRGDEPTNQLAAAVKNPI